MRIELTKLLARRPVMNPNRVERVTISGDRLEILVTGFPWWSGVPGDGRPRLPSSISLVFEGVSSGSLPVDFNDTFGHDLEEFSVQCLADLGWAQPPIEEIYCSGPIPDPIALYTLLQRRLHEAGAFLRADDLLNQCDLLSDFLELASGNSFLLARTPAVLRRLLCAELDRQGVPYSVVGNQARVDSRLWVRFCGESFLCARAHAEAEQLDPIC
jgi:hypothetical protein